MRIDLRELILVIVAFLGIFYFNEWQTNMIHKQEVITCYDKLPNINGKLPIDSKYNPYQSQPRNLTLDQLHFADLIAKENLKDDKSADLLDFYANASTVIAYNHLLYVQTSEKYTIYRYELLKGISRTCNSESVYSEVSRITLSNIKQYFWMIQSIYESLNKCNSILVSNVQNKEPSYSFGLKNDELLQAKNVLMYKKIKTVLVGSERKSKLMATIDLLLYYVFQLSNTCLERFYLITNTPESVQIKLFDMAYSVEDILDGKKQGDEITDDEKNRRKQAGKQNINFIEDTLRSAQEERYSSEHEQKND